MVNIDQGTLPSMDFLFQERDVSRFMPKSEQYQQFKLNAFQSESQDITLYTEEGDKVTISTLSQFEASFMDSDYSAELRNASVSAQMKELNVSSANSFQISVEGDLNDEEQEDIQEILGKLEGMMTDLLNGDLDSIMNEALGLLDGADSISGVEATLEFHQRLNMESQTMTRMYGPPPPLPNGSERPPLTKPPMNGEKPPLGDMSFENDIAVKISNQLMEMIESTNIEPGKFQEPINQLFSNLRSQVQAGNGETDWNSQLLDIIQQQLLGNLTTNTNQTEGVEA